jgi:hypothetical protein
MSGKEMRTRKTKTPSVRDKLSEQFLKALEEDFRLHGAKVLAEMREAAPERYAELAGKVITSAADPPDPNDLAGAETMHELALRMVRQIGFEAPDEASIHEAHAAVDSFVAALEVIRDRRQGGEFN